jgi:Lon protease-like protein
MVCLWPPTMLPTTIPIFPLPNVVLFPGVFLPLHIFEARYRAMVRDALGGDRIIGMVLLRPGWQNEYEGRPPVYPVGCAGLITHAVPLDDGRYNIVLHGLSKFRIVGEEGDRAYRVARIEPLAETLDEAARETMRGTRQRLEALLATMIDAADQRLPVSMPDEELVNALAQYLELEPVERQALLERNDVLDRCESLIDLLEMKTMVPRDGWGSGTQ